MDGDGLRVHDPKDVFNPSDDTHAASNSAKIDDKNALTSSPSLRIRGALT